MLHTRASAGQKNRTKAIFTEKTKVFEAQRNGVNRGDWDKIRTLPPLPEYWA
jgi:hypothetical protein